MSRTPTRRLVPVALATVLAVTAVAPIAAEPVAARDGATLVNLVNERRAAHAVPPVSLHAVIDQIAVERADQMAAARSMTHDLGYVKDRLAKAGVCWQAMGEIIAWNTRPESERLGRFVDQWYNSEGHRKIMLGSGYTHAGGSWTTGSDGRHYGAMIFVRICGASATTTGFTDIGSSAFKSEIKWLVENKITAGCTSTAYCPTATVTREQMASFIRRATGVPALSTGWFTDVGASMHQSDIFGIAAAKIASGCTDLRYCPGSTVTRGQMASFLVRALNLPLANRDYFSDDNGSTHERAINSLAAAGITAGCAPGRFCPTSSVTREQMAGFLYRAFRR